MKTITFFSLLSLLYGVINSSQAQTTIAAGNWSNPAIWSGGIPPVTSGTVVVNHAVVLDMDYAHYSGSVTVGANGSITGNSPMRAFALNFSSGSASLTVNGSFTVARVPFGPGNVNINGVATIDSLYSAANITVASNGILNAEQFMNNTGGVITNNGSIVSINFLNVATVTNNHHMISNDFCNSKTFTNASSGWIEVTNDFSNIDTLANPAIFTNDGVVGVADNWLNNVQMNGAGKWCVGGNSYNAGSMSGTFDFCDQTGGNVDFNTGTIAVTITSCVNPCVLSVDEQLTDNDFSIAPNPFDNETTIATSTAMNNATLLVYNLQGQLLKQIPHISGKNYTLSSEGLENGVYFLQVIEHQLLKFEQKIIVSSAK